MIQHTSNTAVETYDALAQLNRSFAATIECINRLENLRLVDSVALVHAKARLEHDRAALASLVIETLQELEQRPAARSDPKSRELEDQSVDPDDVLVSARRRRRDILDQIRELHRSLERGRRGKARRG